MCSRRPRRGGFVLGTIARLLDGDGGWSCEGVGVGVWSGLETNTGIGCTWKG